MSDKSHQPSGLGLGLAAAKQQHAGGAAAGSSTSQSSARSISSSRPIGIGLGRATNLQHHVIQNRLPQHHAAGPMLASSAPVYDPLFVPKAPVPRPRASMADPPAMTLPPSPPVWERHMPGEAAGGREKKAPKQQHAATYSRSLSNQPSYEYFLQNYGQPLGGASTATTSHHSSHPSMDDVDEDEEDDDYLDDDLPPTGRLGRKPSAGAEKEEKVHKLDTTELGKSPTVFSLLSGKPNLPANLPAHHSLPPRSSLLGSINNPHITSTHATHPSSRAQPSIDKPPIPPSHHPAAPSSSTATSTSQSIPQRQPAAQAQRAAQRPAKRSDVEDELQFDINLDDDKDDDDDADNDNDNDNPSPSRPQAAY